MTEVEKAIAEQVADELEASEVPAAPSGMTTLHGGPGTSAGLNFSPEASASGGGVAGQHEGVGTRPLAGDYVAPTGGAEDAAVEQDRADAFAVVVAQVRRDRAAADASFARFCKGPVETTGYVTGLEHLQSLQDEERKKP